MPTGIIIHATAGASAASSIDWMRKERTSYHFIIPRDGEDSKKTLDIITATLTPPVIQYCVPVTEMAFHCSSRVAPPNGLKGSLAQHCIGISLANLQNGEHYTDGQIDALIWLLKEIKRRMPEITWVTSHKVVQPWNRVDPRGLACQVITEMAGLSWWEPTKAAIQIAKPKGEH